MKRMSKTTYDEFSKIIDEIDQVILELTGIDMKSLDERAKFLTEGFTPVMEQVTIQDDCLILNITKEIF